MIIEQPSGSTSQKRIYLSIIDGQLAYKVDKNEQGAVERKNKNGITVYEKYIGGIGGFLKSVKPKDSEFGKQWEITVLGQEGLFVLNIPYSSRYANNFFLKVENVDLNHEVVILVGKYLGNDNVSRPYLSFKQGDVKIEYYYVKDDPRVPKGKKIVVNKKEIYDESEKLDFFESIAQRINSKLSGDDATPSSQQQAKEVEQPKSSVNHNNPNDDDLPF